MTAAPPSEADPLALEAAQLAGAPAAPAEAFLDLGRRLFGARRLAEADALTGQAVERHPAEADLWNLRGVVLRVLRRPSEALAALDRARALAPGHIGVQVNRGNVLMDQGDAEAARAAFADAARRDPNAPATRRLLARALMLLGRADEAIAEFRAATELAPKAVDAWLDLTGVLRKLGRLAEAEQAFAAALAVNDDELRLWDGRIRTLRTMQEHERAVALLRAAVARRPDAAILHLHLGDLLREAAPAEGLAHIRRAVALDPDGVEARFVLLQALNGEMVRGDAARLDEAHALARALLNGADPNALQTSLLSETFTRACASHELAALDALRSARAEAEGVYAPDLFPRLGLATTAEKRRMLLDQHRLWARGAEAAAAAAPLPKRSRTRAPGGRIRVGLLSSDLRGHAVGVFAMPLFEHLDPERFEVFVYSHHAGAPDALELEIRRRVAHYNAWPGLSARATAERIAADELDVLIDLGGHTRENRPDVLAWRPAPVQAAWLGYPHSVGLSSVDHFICDPHNRPTASGLLIEAPLMLPQSWIAVGPALARRYPTPAARPPSDRRGHLTFGTAGNPNKYAPQVLAAWARIAAATAGSRFAIVRPEAGSQAFRANVAAAFAAEGVDPDRIEWRAIGGAHLACYDDIDISLDTFPLTGGVTTVDSLMMGVPVVSLAGEAFHERLSRSILVNTGLADLCAEDVAGYVDAALALAADRPRLAALRAGLREQVLSSPLGDDAGFARDFYDLIAGVTSR